MTTLAQNFVRNSAVYTSGKLQTSQLCKKQPHHDRQQQDKRSSEEKSNDNFEETVYNKF